MRAPRRTRMMLPLLAALAAAAAPAAPAADTARAFPFPVEVHSLPNGLRVVFIQYDAPGLVAYYTLMRVGSRTEVEKGRSGYAHFIEYEADRFQNLSYDEPAFRTEAGAILGEYTKSASNPEQKMFERMMETAFTRHTYAHTVIGYLKDIQNMPSGFEYSREFFRRYYTPDNATIFIAGDFDRPSTLALLEKAYGGWKGRMESMPIAREPKQRQSRRAQVDWDKPTLPRIWITWHTPGADNLRAAAVQNVLNAYLFGPTSPLYQSLVLGKQQLVDSMDATYSDHRDPNLFGVLIRVKDAKNLRAVEFAVLREIRKLASGGVDARRLEAVRSNLRYSNIMGLDKADSAAVTLAVNTALTGDVNFLNKEFDAVAQIQPRDLQDFAKAYFIDLNRTTVTLVTAGKVGVR